MKMARLFLPSIFLSLASFAVDFTWAADSAEQSLPGKSWMIFSKAPGESAVGAVSASGEVSFQAIGAPDETFSGVCQTVSCAPGQELVFRVEVRVGKTLERGRGQISIEWKDAKGQEIIRSFGPVWGPEVPQKEQGFEMTAIAPEETASAALVVTFLEDGGAKGSFEVLDATLQR